MKENKKKYLIDDLVVHSDERGFLYEALRFKSQNIPGDGQIYVYSVAPGARRGDHYHSEKSEWFFCAFGSVRVLMKTKEGELINEMLDYENPKMIYAGPGTSHAVVNETNSEAIIIAYGSKEFDPSNPDTTMKKAD